MRRASRSVLKENLFVSCISTMKINTSFKCTIIISEKLVNEILLNQNNILYYINFEKYYEMYLVRPMEPFGNGTNDTVGNGD